MKRGRSTKGMTKEEAAWVTAIKLHGCLLCERRGFPRDPDGPLAEAHHLLEGGIRRGHLDTVPLCPWHHRGTLIVAGWTFQTHRRILGPALSEGSVPFHREWGSDDALLRLTRRIIAGKQRAIA